MRPVSSQRIVENELNQAEINLEHLLEVTNTIKFMPRLWIKIEIVYITLYQGR